MVGDQAHGWQHWAAAAVVEEGTVKMLCPRYAPVITHPNINLSPLHKLQLWPSSTFIGLKFERLLWLKTWSLERYPKAAKRASAVTLVSDLQLCLDSTVRGSPAQREPRKHAKKTSVSE